LARVAGRRASAHYNVCHNIVSAGLAQFSGKAEPGTSSTAEWGVAKR
jgi:hypothetical protein